MVMYERCLREIPIGVWAKRAGIGVLGLEIRANWAEGDSIKEVLGLNNRE